MPSPKKIAIVHYWLVSWRGGEKVLEQVLKQYPNADLYTHVYDPEIINKYLPSYTGRIKTTFIQNLPWAKKHYQKYVALMPYALEQLDLTGYDLVISFESGPAKNIVTHPNATHICYCHSPMRYVWDMYHLYQEQAGLLTRLLMKPLIHYLKMSDQLSANRVDYFISNSDFIAKRIQKCYRREATTIYPPVAIEDFSPIATSEKKDYYLYLGQLVKYKQPELVVDTFNANGKPLIMIGDGELKEHLSQKAKSNIQILGKQDFETIKRHLAEAKALIFPGEEDFGIVRLEAIASGTPVIAYRSGGACETIIENKSGLFFDEQTQEALNSSIKEFESSESIFAEDFTSTAERFSSDRFIKEFTSLVDNVL